jgi:hypothetical protein
MVKKQTDKKALAARGANIFNGFYFRIVMNQVKCLKLVFGVPMLCQINKPCVVQKAVFYQKC